MRGGAQTCTQLLAFRENWWIYPRSGRPSSSVRISSSVRCPIPTIKAGKAGAKEGRPTTKRFRAKVICRCRNGQRRILLLIKPQPNSKTFEAALVTGPDRKNIECHIFLPPLPNSHSH